jgi:hypothetical protein
LNVDPQQSLQSSWKPGSSLKGARGARGAADRQSLAQAENTVLASVANSWAGAVNSSFVALLILYNSLS